MRRIVTASAFFVLSSMTASAKPPVEYWLCRSSTGVMGAQDRPCDPSQQTVAAPSSAQIPSQPAPPVQPRPAERPRVNVPAQRPARIEDAFQPIVTMVWKLAFWVIAMLALVTVGKIWLRGRLGKKTPRSCQTNIRNDHRLIAADSKCPICGRRRSGTRPVTP